MNNKEYKEIEKQYEYQFLRSEPIEYKGVILHPILCDKVIEAYASVYCLLYDPLRYDSLISTLPRLYFLSDILNYKDDVEYILNNKMLLQLFSQLQFLLNLVLKDQEYRFVCSKNRWYIEVKQASGEVVNIKAKDFEVIRKIILHQNGIDYDDTFIHEDIRQWIAEQESVEKNNETTIEDYMEAFMLQMGSCDMEAFKKVPLRRFNRIIEKTLARENYKIQMTASMSGFVTFKGKIDHWISVNKKNSIYDKYFKELK